MKGMSPGWVVCPLILFTLKKHLKSPTESLKFLTTFTELYTVFEITWFSDTGMGPFGNARHYQ